MILVSGCEKTEDRFYDPPHLNIFFWKALYRYVVNMCCWSMIQYRHISCNMEMSSKIEARKLLHHSHRDNKVLQWKQVLPVERTHTFKKVMSERREDEFGADEQALALVLVL